MDSTPLSGNCQDARRLRRRGMSPPGYAAAPPPGDEPSRLRGRAGDGTWGVQRLRVSVPSVSLWFCSTAQDSVLHAFCAWRRRSRRSRPP